MSPDDMFYISRRNLDSIWKVALKLYKEMRMKGDEMRDAAQKLDAMIRDVVSADNQNDSYNPST